jgi:acyl carrier protein
MLIELDDVCRTVGLVLGKQDPKPDDRIQADLGGESIDVLNITVTVQQKYSVTLHEADMVHVSTIRDLYALLTKNADGTARSNADRPA